MSPTKRLLLLTSFFLLLMTAKHYFGSHKAEELQLSNWFKPGSRQDVITTTDWLAPVLWEGTFNREPLEKYYRKQNITVGLAVFVIRRFADRHLELFLQSANKFFMPGHRVIVYIMADTYVKLPDVESSPLRTFQNLVMGEQQRWHNLDLVRMKVLGEHLVEHIQNEVDFLFSMTTNLVFEDEFGVETLGTSVAQLHAWWYFRNTKNFPYERRHTSAAYIPFGQGDFYYDGSIVGGTPHQMLDIIEDYLKGVVQDIEKGLNSTYEKYLNKYFFLNKPTKLLSPEYSWDPRFRLPLQVRYVKVSRHAREGY